MVENGLSVLAATQHEVISLSRKIKMTSQIGAEYYTVSRHAQKLMADKEDLLMQAQKRTSLEHL